MPIQMTEDQIAKLHLKPPIRPRRVIPRVCAFCKFCAALVTEDGQDYGAWQCQRDTKITFDVGDGYQWRFTCDRWKSEED